jgi:hypothetical protein
MISWGSGVLKDGMAFADSAVDSIETQTDP